MSREPSAVRIRPGTIEDLDALVAIEEAAFAPEEQASRRAFRHAARSPTMSLLVVESGGRPRGYVILERRRGSSLARLTSVAVAPGQGRRGLGARLLRAAEEEARAHGADRLRLEVRADNPARHFYQGAGYSRFAVGYGYYDDGADAWRYEKPLGSACGDSRAKRSTSRSRSTKARAP